MGIGIGVGADVGTPKVEGKPYQRALTIWYVSVFVCKGWRN